jgi:hypothetical protein
MAGRGLLLVLLLLLAGCLTHDQPRATAEHLQLKKRVAVVVLIDPGPRLEGIAPQPTQSIHGRATLAGWDARAAVEPYLAGRLRGKGLSVVPLDYAPADYAAVYASSMAYPNPAQVAAPLRALAAAAGADMLVVVYRQAQRDFVGESVENLVGYGVARHTGGAPQAYATVLIEAVDVASGSLIARAPGSRALPLPDAAWREEWLAGEPVDIGGPAAAPLAAALTGVLEGAVLTAAQESGLSH